MRRSVCSCGRGQPCRQALGHFGVYPKISVTWHEAGDGKHGWAAMSHAEKNPESALGGDGDEVGDGDGGGNEVGDGGGAGAGDVDGNWDGDGTQKRDCKAWGDTAQFPALLPFPHDPSKPLSLAPHSLSV
ncbi:hypothetical protein llap_12763 [Limosa lapponica baueri]|uniref:Uncharacterized protein n=1 Tax=Limosa lapponica baueri TaxID=1758121 RepID=A0A2I0TT11_LIMLA|nr:hypothetical protein llap_12763 [Limosa lapponica baueri]